MYYETVRSPDLLKGPGQNPSDRVLNLYGTPVPMVGGEIDILLET